MTDYPVLIPTAEGPVGGIVSVPTGEARAAAFLLPGYSRPARSGINSLWTRIARSLAEQGVIALRVDYCREGETLPIGEGVSGQVRTRELDLRLLDQVLAWFLRRLQGLDLFLAGACAGSRLAIEIAGANPDAVARTFLIVPHLRRPLGTEPTRGEDRAGAAATDADIVDPLVVEAFRAMLARAPSWILIGERDASDIPSLERLLGPRAARLEVEVVPGVALHFLDQPHLQREASRRLRASIGTALTELDPVGGGVPSRYADRVPSAVDVEDLPGYLA